MWEGAGEWRGLRGRGGTPLSRLDRLTLSWVRVHAICPTGNSKLRSYQSGRCEPRWGGFVRKHSRSNCRKTNGQKTQDRRTLEITDRCPGGGEVPVWGTQTTRLCTLTHVAVKTGANEPVEDHRMLKDDGARVVWRVRFGSVVMLHVLGCRLTYIRNKLRPMPKHGSI